MKETREKQVLELLQTQEYATVIELATVLSTSTSTIRRMLESLQTKGLVTRTHGGVKLNGENAAPPSFSFRIHQNSFEKKKMALAAIKLIKNGDVIFIDGSTSAFYIADYLKEFQNIRVITNGIDTLSLLAKNNILAYSTGGQVSSENPSVLVGRYAEDMLCNFHADIAFFSAQSMDSDGEIYDCFEEENFLRRTIQPQKFTGGKERIGIQHNLVTDIIIAGRGVDDVGLAGIDDVEKLFLQQIQFIVF